MKEEKKEVAKKVTSTYKVHPKHVAIGKPLVAILPKVWGKTAYNLMGDDLEKTVTATTKEKKEDGSCCVAKEVSWKETIKGAGQQQLKEYYENQEAGNTSEQIVIKG